MPELIVDGEIHTDEWQYLEKADDPLTQVIPEGKIVLHISAWLVHAEQLSGRLPAGLGVWLDSDDEPEQLSNPQQFPLIAINFPKFADGRGYSAARLLRDRFNFKGELRAIGDVLLDQLFYMQRCGFNSFALRSDRPADKAISGLSVFSEVYQGATDEPLPLFRRRVR